jgi:NAD(P)-dependent dehydrogenase (short-subunit alcohol dehydrogenase family)
VFYMFDLTGKVALVTGASRGIGKGIALALAKAGADVAVNYVGNLEKANQTAQEILDLGRRAIVVKADVSEKAEVEAMVNEVVAQLGKIDALVNNAGVLSLAPFLQLSEEDWDRVIGTNLKGEFLVAQMVANHMVKAGTPGSIINISSIASGQTGIGGANLTHYCAAKGGVIALTESMAIELGSYNIRVNAIAPGAIDTDMIASFKTNEQFMQGVMVRLAIKKLGTPEDIGAMAVFLVSDEASYCTGATFYVDGGYLAG